MTSRRWSTFVSSSVFVLALATGGSAGAIRLRALPEFYLGRPVRAGLWHRDCLWINRAVRFRLVRQRGPCQRGRDRRVPSPHLRPEYRPKATDDRRVSVGLQCRDLGAGMERLDASRSQQTLTRRSAEI